MVCCPSGIFLISIFPLMSALLPLVVPFNIAVEPINASLVKLSLIVALKMFCAFAKTGSNNIIIINFFTLNFFDVRNKKQKPLNLVKQLNKKVKCLNQESGIQQK